MFAITNPTMYRSEMLSSWDCCDGGGSAEEEGKSSSFAMGERKRSDLEMFVRVETEER